MTDVWVGAGGLMRDQRQGPALRGVRGSHFSQGTREMGHPLLLCCLESAETLPQRLKPGSFLLAGCGTTEGRALPGPIFG